MAQFDLIITQNVSVAGVEFTERAVNIAKGGLLSAAGSGVPTVIPGGSNLTMLIRDDAEVTGLKWIAQPSLAQLHNQNTDTGTNAASFDIDSDGTTNGVKLKTNLGILELRDLTDVAYADLIVKNLTVKGTTTTIESSTLAVADKNIELGSITSPTDTTADGGGFTLHGATDKTILWNNSTDAWDFNQSLNLASGFVYRINGVALSYSDVGAMQTWVTAPATKTSAGVAGTWAKDLNYLYVCVATNVWTRVPLATNWV